MTGASAYAAGLADRGERVAHTRRDTATALEPTLIRVLSASRVGAGLLGGRSQVIVTALDGVRRSISAGGSDGESEAKSERAADVPMDDAAR